MMHMILTDYRQRSRQFSFRLLAVFAVFSAVLLAPRQTGSFRVLVLDPHYFAQANNPTWAPVGVVAVLTFFFPFIGLVLARQGMSQDRESGILSALLTGPFKKIRYVAGEFLTNCLLLLTILVFVMMGTLAMMVIQYPGQGLHISQFIATFAILIPGVGLISALAVISETIPGLRGRFGTSILIMLLFIGYAMMIEAKWYAQVIDFSGIVLLQALFKQSALESGHRLTSMMILGGNDHLSRAGTHDLVFQPLTLSSTQWLCIGGSVLLSLMLVGLAGLFLERRPLARRMTHQRSALRITLPEADANEAIFNAVSIQHFSWPALWRQAMKQLLASRSVGWWLILAGLWIANWLAPTSSLRSTLLPITYLWALLFFSQLGWPEQRNGLATWLTTINFAEKRHLNVTLLVAGCFSILLALPTCIRLGVTAWPLLSWALMLPVVAMLLGFVTKTGQWTQLIVTVLLFFVVAGLSGILPVATTATGILTGVGYLMIGAASLVGLELAV